MIGAIQRRVCLGLLVAVLPSVQGLWGLESNPEIGIAVRDITPELPIRLAGYAARQREADKVDCHLLTQAVALKNSSGERFVLVALDNCEVSHAFMQPVLETLHSTLHLAPGEVAVVSSHTHSAPVLRDVL